MANSRSHPPSPLTGLRRASPPSEARSPSEAPDAPARGAKEGGASADQLRRLRWRARRGLLENDLLLGRFLERQGDTLTAAEVDALGRLLELPDPVLFELLLGRQRPAGELDVPAVRNVLARLESNTAAGAGAGPEST